MSNLEPIFQENFSSLSLGGTDGLFENKSNSGRAGLKACLVLFFATFF
jgi:hypothetical protein